MASAERGQSRSKPEQSEKLGKLPLFMALLMLAIAACGPVHMEADATTAGSIWECEEADEYGYDLAAKRLGVMAEWVDSFLNTLHCQGGWEVVNNNINHPKTWVGHLENSLGVVLVDDGDQVLSVDPNINRLLIKGNIDMVQVTIGWVRISESSDKKVVVEYDEPVVVGPGETWLAIEEKEESLPILLMSAVTPSRNAVVTVSGFVMEN